MGANVIRMIKKKNRENHQDRRNWQFLTDQLTLYQPGGAHYPHPVLQASRIFRPCDGPVVHTYNVKIS